MIPISATRTETAGRAISDSAGELERAIAEGNVQAINYFVANNYVKALEALGVNTSKAFSLIRMFCCIIAKTSTAERIVTAGIQYHNIEFGIGIFHAF